MLPQQEHHEPSFSPVAPQVLLEDLTLVIDITLLVAFATAVHLLRQKLIAVATLAHALSVAFLVFTVGHYIEIHVIGMDGVEDLVSRRGPGRGGRVRWWLVGWPTAGLLSIGAVLALVARFWSCKGEGGDCVVGGADPPHNRCKIMRLRFFSPVFSATVVFVYLCISSRLNALLGGSVFHPRGGGYALAVLVSPALLSTICLSGCASVWLYAVLVEAQASGESDRYQPIKTNGGNFGAASRTKRQRRAKKRTEDAAWAAAAPYSSHRGEKGDHAHLRHWPPNNHELNRHSDNTKQSSSSPRSPPEAGGSAESDFEASSSCFLFGGGGGAGFGVAGRAASSSSSLVSTKRWQLQKHQQEQRQQRGLDGAAVAWDSRPQGGFRRAGESRSGGSLSAVRQAGSLLGGRDARHTSDAAAASVKYLPLRPNSESKSVFGGRSSTMGSSFFCRERRGATAASVGNESSAVVGPALILDPPFFSLPGGVGTGGGGSRFSGAGRGKAVKRPPLPVGSTNGWTSSSSSSSGASSPGRARGRREKRKSESRSRSDPSTSGRDTTSDDHSSSSDGDGGGIGLRTRRPSSLSHAKFIPSSSRSFEAGEEGTRRGLRHLSASSSSSGASSSSSSASREEEEEAWSVASSGMWGRPAGESRPAGIKPAVGVHAFGWGGGGGRNFGAGLARGAAVVGGRSTAYNGSAGRGSTEGSLVRRRPTHGA